MAEPSVNGGVMGFSFERGSDGQSPEGPWPHLSSFFKYKSRDDMKLRFECLLCRPKYVQLSAYVNSASNLRKHTKNKHPEAVAKLAELSSVSHRRRRVSIFEGAGRVASLGPDFGAMQTSPEQPAMESSFNGSDFLMAGDGEQELQLNTWPQLSSIFEFKSRDEMKLIFYCHLCMSYVIESIASAESPSNLLNHIKGKHPESLSECMQLLHSASGHEGFANAADFMEMSTTEGSQSLSLPITSPKIEIGLETEDDQSHKYLLSRQEYNPLMDELWEDELWPYLSSMFLVKSRDSAKKRFQCLLCRPKLTHVTAYGKSLLNLLKHIEKKHPESLSEFADLLPDTSKFPKNICNDNPSTNSTPAQFTTTSTKEHLNPIRNTKTSVIPENSLDEIIVKFVCETQQPFSIVSAPSFRELICGIYPNRPIMCERALKLHVFERRNAIVLRVKRLLEQQNWISATADSWSIRDQIYLCVSAHWINESTLSRKSALLACRRFKNCGDSNHKVIAKLLLSIFIEYEIEHKISSITVDNGIYFNKSFEKFNLGDCIPKEIQEPNDEHDETENMVEFIELGKLLSLTSNSETVLPYYQQCAVHLLNLVATTDACIEKVISQNDESMVQTYKALLETSMSKCVALWGNCVISEFAAKEGGVSCQFPSMKLSISNWKDNYDAVKRLLRIFEDQGVEALHTMCDELECSRLDICEVEFLKDWHSVMTPLVQAIEVLQDKRNMFMGYLIPTLNMLLEKLEELRDTGTTCSCLAKTMILEIGKRFQSVLENIDLVAAALLVPFFKTSAAQSWQFERAKERIRELLAAEECYQNPKIEPTENEDYDTAFSFFRNKRRRKSLIHSDILESFLADEDDSLDGLLLCRWKKLKSIFIRLNCDLPASSASGSLFKASGNKIPYFIEAMSHYSLESQLIVHCNLDF